VTANLQKFLVGLGAVAISAAAAGCGGEFVRDSRSPVRLVIDQLQVADQQNTLLSDVRRTTDPCSVEFPCTFNDAATVEMRVELRDPGSLGIGSAPSALNAVTITRYRVTYRRADGNNVQGVDIPYAFDSAFTMTVPAAGTQAAAFQIVRHSQKEEAPLRALGPNGGIISTIAEVTFYGHDQAGNELSVSGFIGVDFGDFADSSSAE
jgi:hypothetical protein